MMVQAGAPPTDKPLRIRGYKDIAKYIGEQHGVDVTESEVCRWASWNTPLEQRLPVDRPTRRRVYAQTVKLDAWVLRWLKGLIARRG